MKICFVSHTADLGGGERSLIQLVKSFSENKINCCVVLPKDGPLEQEISKYAKIIKSEYEWWTLKRGSKRQRVKTGLKVHINGAERLLDKIRDEKFDLIYTNTSVICEGALVAKKLNIPHVWHIRELGEKDHGFIFKFGFANTAKLINKYSDKVILNSSAVLREFDKYIEPSKCDVVYNSVSVSQNLIDQKSLINFKNENSFKLIIAGTISRKKGQVDAIKATLNLLSRDLNVELIILGNCRDEALWEKLNKLISESKHKEAIQIHSFQENPYCVMKNADCLLVCSRNEAFGRTIIEGMLLNIPVISTNRGGVPEIIDDNINGLLYEPGNYIELSEKIFEVMSNVELRNKLTVNGYLTATNKFNNKNYSGKIYDLISKLLYRK